MKSLSVSVAEPQTQTSVATFSIGPGLKGTTPFKLLPSVGSWYSCKLEDPEPDNVQPIAFQRMPSVGTWLAPKPLVDSTEVVAPQAASLEIVQGPAVPFFIMP